MRVSREKAADNRRRMLTVASRLLRERGIGACGVDAVSAAAGLTHGAVYSRFGSKAALAAEALREALAGSAHMWQRLAEREGRDGAFSAIVRAYLSRAHRDLPAKGCVVAALGGEIGRQGACVRRAFTGELKRALGVLARAAAPATPSRGRDEALGAFAAMLGALILSRAVSDRALSDRILKATAEQLLDGWSRQQGARRSRARDGRKEA